MIRIKAFVSGMNDQCSWYRGAGPLNRLQRDFPTEFQIDYCKQFSFKDWHELTGYDLFFILRPYTNEHLQMIACANYLNVPVVADYDDNFFYTGKHVWLEMVGMDKRHKTISECVLRSDKVLVSTKFLGEVYGANTVLIENGFNAQLFPELRGFIPVRNKIVAWRGSETHDPDLLPIRDEFVRIMNFKFDWTTNFYWGNPRFISYFIKHKHQMFTIPQFHHHLQIDKPKILMHPLQDDDFNKGKSNCAWIEGTMASTLVIGPEMYEWSTKPNCFSYRTAKEFGVVLHDLMHMDEDSAKRFVEQGQDYILQNLELGKLNEKRKEVFASVLKKEIKTN